MIFVFGERQFDFSSRTFIMGVLNVTPDSFSDGGKFFSVSAAVDHAHRMIAEGADIIDIGGESTRPGNRSNLWQVDAEEELRRVLPVIEQLHHDDKSIVLSIDTTKASVAEEALLAGACIVNDISGFNADSAMAVVTGKYNASAVLMHMQGTPDTMQRNPKYDNVIDDIKKYFYNSIQIAHKAGIQQIIIDPGIGFGKNLNHNLEILRKLREFQELGFPVLVGPSRKSFIGKITGAAVDQRLAGTAAAVAAAILGGAQIVRVHDVGFMKQVCLVTDALVHTV
ncbi:MAG: dihydropteroate synthase [Bacteroidota bacterium]